MNSKLNRIAKKIVSGVIYSPKKGEEKRGVFPVNIWDDYASKPQYDYNDSTYMYLESSEIHIEDQLNITRLLFGAAIETIYSEPEIFYGCEVKVEKRKKNPDLDDSTLKFQSLYEVRMYNFDREKFDAFVERMEKKNLRYKGAEISIGSSS